MPKPKQLRPYAWEKSAFLEDASEDSLISDAAFRVLQKICTAYNRKAGYAECARTFIVDRVPVSIKTVQRARKLLLSLGRIFIVREPLGRASTRYGVNWYYRGADIVRAENGGEPILDCRFQSVAGTLVSSLEGTLTPPCNDTNVPPTARRGDTMSPKPIILPFKGKNNTSASPTHALSGGVARAGGVVKVVAADVLHERGDMILALHLEDEDGEQDILQIIVESSDPNKQDKGQQQLEKLTIACSMSRIDSGEELIGHSFIPTANGDFLPVPANENTPHQRTTAEEIA